MKRLTIEEAVSNSTGGRRILFNQPSRLLRKTMTCFRAAQCALGPDCSVALFIVPVSNKFKIRPVNMLSHGTFNPHFVYNSTCAAPYSHCLFPTSRMEALFCMSPTALKAGLHPQAEVRAQASQGGLLPLQFSGLVGPTTKGSSTIMQKILWIVALRTALLIML